MKIDPNDFAFPSEGSHVLNTGGLTIRAEFAARAMQGLISSIGSHDLLAADDISHDAVMFADALINALNDSH